MVEYAYKENGVMKLKPVALSLSQSEIDEIATELLEAMQPDWENAIALPSNFNGYVAPENGMIVGWATRSGTGNLQISINGVAVARGDTASSIYAPASIQCIVNKGDVITTSTTPGSKMSFVPFKTMNPVSLRPLDPHKIDTAILNHWDDITSDFSTAGSSNMAIDNAKYNPALRKLRIKCHNTTSQASGSGRAFVITYNGSDLTAFTDSCIYTGSKIQTSDIAGFEFSAWVKQANQVSFYIYNRTSSAWPANTYTNIQVEF